MALLPIHAKIPATAPWQIRTKSTSATHNGHFSCRLRNVSYQSIFHWRALDANQVWPLFTRQNYLIGSNRGNGHSPTESWSSNFGWTNSTNNDSIHQWHLNFFLSKKWNWDARIAYEYWWLKWFMKHKLLFEYSTLFSQLL